MSASKHALNTLIAGAFATTLMASAAMTNDAQADSHAKEKEKCYGVVKAGKNGCGSADGKHSCAGQATVDGSGQEWIKLPKGLCEKLVGGSTEPYADKAHKKMKHDAMKKHDDMMKHGDHDHGQE